MLTEVEVRQWIREEIEAAFRARQEECLHAEAGTLREDGTVTCNQCGKALTYGGK